MVDSRAAHDPTGIGGLKHRGLRPRRGCGRLTRDRPVSSLTVAPAYDNQAEVTQQAAADIMCVSSTFLLTDPAHSRSYEIMSIFSAKGPLTLDAHRGDEADEDVDEL